MHILYLHQHFAVPSGSTGTRSYEFARRWVKAGHKVTVITGHYDIGGLEFSKKPQVIDGIEVRIVGTRYGNKMSFFRRVWAFIVFMFCAFATGLKVKNVDAIFATSTPLTIGVPAVLLKWFKRVPFVFEVRDEWPRIPVEMGFITNPVLVKFLFGLERFIYNQSAGVVALSPGMACGVENSLSKVKRPLVIASNSSDLDRFSPDVDGSDIRQQFGWGDKFVLLHFGAMGKANGLDFLIHAADKLRENKEIYFTLVGGGSEKERLKNMQKELALDNLEILDSMSKEILPELVAAADVSLVIFADYPILEHNSANKFFDSLSAGKPVLLNYSGWHRDVIEKGKAGFGTDQSDLEQFVEKVRYLYESQDNLHKLGESARKIAEVQFSRDLISSRVLEFIQSVVKDRKS